MSRMQSNRSLMIWKRQMSPTPSRPSLEATRLSRMSVSPRYFEKPAGSARAMLSFCEARRRARPAASSPLARCCCPKTPITTGAKQTHEAFRAAVANAGVLTNRVGECRRGRAAKERCEGADAGINEFVLLRATDHARPSSTALRAVVELWPHLALARLRVLETRDVSAARSEGIPACSAFSTCVLSSPSLEVMRATTSELRT